jgi:hypothetical protein
MQQAGRELTSVDLRVVTNDKQDFLGSTGQTGDGRVFRYVKNGPNAQPAGIVLCTPYTNNFVGLTVSGSSSTLIAAGVYEIKVQLNGTAVGLNDLQDGEIDILTGTGKGTSYRIRGNTPATAFGIVTITMQSPLILAVPAGSIVNLGYSLWYNLTTDIAVDQSVSATNKHHVGVTTVAMGANQYGWVQTNGRGLVTSDNRYYNGTSVVTGVIPQGFSLVLSKTTPGYVTGANPTTDADKQIVGYGLENPYTAGAGILFPADISIG